MINARKCGSDYWYKIETGWVEVTRLEMITGEGPGGSHPTEKT